MKRRVNLTEAYTIFCRRCGAPYTCPNPHALLVACPHCGKAPLPLWKRINTNGLSAVLAVLALVFLTGGVSLPLISTTTLGEERVFSLIGGIAEMFRRGERFIATVLLVFSVIFPYVKLLGLLLATSALVPIAPQRRDRLHTIAVLTGKYSLLDIIVVAMMIVLVKFDGVVEVRALPGTILFCVAILLSIASGLCVRLR